MFQGRLHDILSASHDWMFGCRDAGPPLAGDPYLEAQGRDCLEQQFQIRLHRRILPVARLSL